MKKKISFSLLLFSTMIYSQSYVGFLNDNYNGVHGVISNPANIVDSRLKTDVNLFGISTLIDNDYAAVKLTDLTNDDFNFDKSGNTFPSESNNAIVNLDVLGPSFMFNILPKHSLAFSTRIRGLVNGNDVNGNTIKLIDNNFRGLL